LLDKRVDEALSVNLFTPTPDKPAWVAQQHAQASAMSARLAELRSSFASDNHGTVTVKARDGSQVKAEAPPPSKASVQAVELLATASEYHATQGGQAKAIARAEWVPPEIVEMRAVCDAGAGQGIPPEKQAKQQYAMAMHLLGRMGPKPAKPTVGAMSNEEQAVRYLESAATKGQVQAQVELGTRLESSGDVSGAQRWYLQAAEGGSNQQLTPSERGAASADAQCRLGSLYEQGKATDREGGYSTDTEAQRWYLKVKSHLYYVSV
jgi:TPR repeat protein